MFIDIECSNGDKVTINTLEIKYYFSTKDCGVIKTKVVFDGTFSISLPIAYDEFQNQFKRQIINIPDKELNRLKSIEE